MRAFSNVSPLAWYWNFMEAPILGGKKLGVGALASTFLGRFSVDFQADVGSLLVQGLRFLQHTFASVAKNARLE